MKTVSYRQSDINELKTKVLQRLFRLISKDGWQSVLFNEAKQEVETKGKFLQIYQPIYSAMKDVGVGNYTAEMMDVTAVYNAIIRLKYCDNITKKTSNALDQVHKGRNKCYGHENTNEDESELYAGCLMELERIEELLRCIRDDEWRIIEESQRNALWIEYSPQIKKLRTLIREEFIKRANVLKDIQNLVDCKNYNESLEIWIKIVEKFFPRGEQADYSGYYEFARDASSAGVRKAHFEALVGSLCLNQYDEVEEYLRRIYDSPTALEEREASEIVSILNSHMSRGESIPKGMIKWITRMSEEGFPVERLDDGTLLWNKQKKGWPIKLSDIAFMDKE